MTLQEIKEATLSDTILKKVLECLKSGKWEEKDVELKAYQMCAEEQQRKQETFFSRGAELLYQKRYKTVRRNSDMSTPRNKKD